jgi:hypothetical protein
MAVPKKPEGVRVEAGAILSRQQKITFLATKCLLLVVTGFSGCFSSDKVVLSRHNAGETG